VTIEGMAVLLWQNEGVGCLPPTEHPDHHIQKERPAQPGLHQRARRQAGGLPMPGAVTSQDEAFQGGARIVDPLDWRYDRKRNRRKHFRSSR